MSLFTSDGGSAHIPAAARSVFDATGAGDTVAGVLALGVAAGHPLLHAAEVANLAAGIVVGKVGTARIESDELTEALAGG
jgi:D-beta-D-heptose 7-phosphate kinase/D-beta-D-heptose 1-phosphate adenosyltransferase